MVTANSQGLATGAGQRTVRMACLALAITIGLLVGMTSVAIAGHSVRLSVAFSPNRPNASTTIHFGYQLSTDDGTVPSPVTAIDLELPKGMGLGLTTLGEAICSPTILENSGSAECPANALMGRGHAVIELPVGNEIVRNNADVSIYMGPPVDRHTDMLFYAHSVTPVSAKVVFQGLLLPSEGGIGASLNTEVPPISTWPEGAYATIVRMQSTLGPEHVTYFRYVHGKRVGYQPIGMAVPAVCPRGGYRFALNLSFADGSRGTAMRYVPCHRKGGGEGARARRKAQR
jgi:hypothetical protein